MIPADRAARLQGYGEVVGIAGHRIGKVEQVYLDHRTGGLSWATVRTGRFGTRESFVPLEGATANGDLIAVPYDKDIVKGAPHHASDVALTVADEDELHAYYGIGPRHDAHDTLDHDAIHHNAVEHNAVEQNAVERNALEQNAVGQNALEHDAVDHRVPDDQALRPDTDLVGRATTDPTDRTGLPNVPAEPSATPDGYLTLSGERLRVGTRTVEAGRARLRKYVVTEQQSVTVPVAREAPIVIREPIGPGEVPGATMGEDAVGRPDPRPGRHRS